MDKPTGGKNWTHDIDSVVDDAIQSIGPSDTKGMRPKGTASSWQEMSEFDFMMNFLQDNFETASKSDLKALLKADIDAGVFTDFPGLIAHLTRLTVRDFSPMFHVNYAIASRYFNIWIKRGWLNYQLDREDNDV